ncbi:MAG: substrate-binding domain-containing protein [bacterium]
MSSIKEIAKRANVSIGTVDRVIHDRGRVSKDTKKKINQIIIRLNYKPNIYARNLSLARTFRFAVLMPKLTQDSGYWRIPADGVDKARHDLEASKVTVQFFHYDRYSESSFRKTFQNVLKEHPDGILIAPVLTNVAHELLQTVSRNVPYVFFDSSVPGAKCLSTIGQESYQSGILAGKLMQMMIKTHGTVVVIKVLPQDFHIDERIRGFEVSLKDASNIHTKICQVDSIGGERAFDEVLKKISTGSQDLQGIFVSNAWTHSVAKYLKSLTPARKIFLIGYDVIARNIAYLKEGVIDFIISPRPEMQGYQGLFSLYRHVALKEKVNKKITVPLDILNKENIDYYQG